MNALSLTPGDALVGAAVPLVVAAILVASLRRGTGGWLVPVIFAVGGWVTHWFNALLLRNVIPALGEHDPATAAEAWYSGFVEAAVPEELVRFVCALALAFAWRRSRSRFTAPELAGGLLASGFALFENLDYARTFPEWRIMAVLSHVGAGIIMGRFLRHALVGDALRTLPLFAALLVPVVMHGLFDSAFFMVEIIAFGVEGNGSAVEDEAMLRALPWMAAYFLVFLAELVWAASIIWRFRREARE